MHLHFDDGNNNDHDCNFCIVQILGSQKVETTIQQDIAILYYSLYLLQVDDKDILINVHKQICYVKHQQNGDLEKIIYGYVTFIHFLCLFQQNMMILFYLFLFLYFLSFFLRKENLLKRFHYNIIMVERYLVFLLVYDDSCSDFVVPKIRGN